MGKLGGDEIYAKLPIESVAMMRSTRARTLTSSRSTSHFPKLHLRLRKVPI